MPSTLAPNRTPMKDFEGRRAAPLYRGARDHRAGSHPADQDGPGQAGGAAHCCRPGLTSHRHESQRVAKAFRRVVHNKNKNARPRSASEHRDPSRAPRRGVHRSCRAAGGRERSSGGARAGRPLAPATSARPSSGASTSSTTRCARRAREFNYAKRFQTAPLDGKVALITGAR